MFDNFLIRQDSLENVYRDGQAVGFKFAVRIADYRGCFLSLHNGYINSEYEGQRDQQDRGIEFLPNEVEQVRHHHEMLRRLGAEC